MDPEELAKYADEDARYLAEWTARREATARRWREREGLLRLTDRPQGELCAGFRRSLPSSRDAARLFELVEAALGDRAVRDAWAAPFESCLLVRDDEDPAWFFPRRLLYLALDWQPPEAPAGGFGEIRMSDRTRRIQERERLEREKNPPPAREPEPLVLAPGGRPGRLRIEAGAAYVDVTYGEGGRFKEWSLTCGDLFAFSNADTWPFVIDPCVRPPREPPLPLLCDPRLEPEGVPVELLAELVLAMPLSDRARVYAPAIEPGTVCGAWGRALALLRAAEFDGRLPEGGGWLVIDAWNGTAVATGATRAEAFSAWREQVATVQPLPPVERHVEPEPEPEPEADEPPDAPTPGEGSATFSTGRIRIEIHPPVVLPWPEPRPENVPAVALPWPAAPPVPDTLAALGFTRTLRLISEQGEVGFTFQRLEPDGFTLVGDDAVHVVSLGDLETNLKLRDAIGDAGFAEAFGPDFARRFRQYPITTRHYRVWDELGRTPELHESGWSQGAEVNARGWDLGLRHQVVRVRYDTRGG